MTAAEARALSMSKENEATKKQLEEIYARIEAAAALGNTNTTVLDLRPAVRAILERDGYQVEHHPRDPRYPRDTDYYSIRW